MLKVRPTPRGEKKNSKNSNVNTLYIYFIQTVKWYIKVWISLTFFFPSPDKSVRGHADLGLYTVISQTLKRSTVQTLGEVRFVSFVRLLFWKVKLPFISTFLNGWTTKQYDKKVATALFGFIQSSTRRGAQLVALLYVEPKCIQIKNVCTRCRLILWTCGMHISLNWLKSIGNRKRVLHRQSFWYSRDVGFTWAYELPTDNGLKLFDFPFFFLFLRNPAETPAVRVSVPRSPFNIVSVFLIKTSVPSFWGWFYDQRVI